MKNKFVRSSKNAVIVMLLFVFMLRHACTYAQ